MSAKRATDDMMDMLHQITAEKLADMIRNGVTALDKEGNEVTLPVPAAYIAAAIKFLKDNGITAEPNSDRFNPLKGGLAEVPVFDEDEEFDRVHMN